MATNCGVASPAALRTCRSRAFACRANACMRTRRKPNASWSIARHPFVARSNAPSPGTAQMAIWAIRASATARTLRVEERLPFVRDQQVVHVVGVVLFLGQDALEHDARRRILI